VELPQKTSSFQGRKIKTENPQVTRKLMEGLYRQKRCRLSYVCFLTKHRIKVFYRKTTKCSKNACIRLKILIAITKVAKVELITPLPLEKTYPLVYIIAIL